MKMQLFFKHHYLLYLELLLHVIIDHLLPINNFLLLPLANLTLHNDLNPIIIHDLNEFIHSKHSHHLFKVCMKVNLIEDLVHLANI